MHRAGERAPLASSLSSASNGASPNSPTSAPEIVTTTAVVDVFMPSSFTRSFMTEIE
jgi:hypothetical protein